jgi:beta-lactamase regulating signal transducer with metallopeptidase domain
MISNFIVISSIILALAFTIVWIVRPNLRRRIEEPKYFFLQQVQQYNRRVSGHSEPETERVDES